METTHFWPQLAKSITSPPLPATPRHSPPLPHTFLPQLAKSTPRHSPPLPANPRHSPPLPATPRHSPPLPATPPCYSIHDSPTAKDGSFPL